MKFKPSTKYKITDRSEMELHLHLRRKGGHVHKDKSGYQRKEKNTKHGFQITVSRIFVSEGGTKYVKHSRRSRCSFEI